MTANSSTSGATSPSHRESIASVAWRRTAITGLSIVLLAGNALAMVATGAAAPSDHASPVAALDRLPIAFERNLGQSDPHVRYLSRSADYEFLFTAQGAHIVLRTAPDGRSAAIRLRVVNGRKGVEPIASSPLPGIVNYLIGDDPAEHIVDIGTFARVTYPSVYPGIDLVYYGNAGRLEYDLVVAPKADPRRIRMAFDGAAGVALSAEGNLVLRTPAGNVEMLKPVAYQDIGNVRREVDARYVIAGATQVGFRVGPYDAEHPLIIDPLLVFATRLWGSATGVALDPNRNIYVVGTTTAKGLPATGGYQTQLAGTQDAYVVKLEPSATSVVYATYLGTRRATTSGLGIAVDASGSAYVTGTTNGAGFPVTPSAYRASGATFVTKLAPAGNALAYSTFVTAPVSSLAVDGGGNAYMTGSAAVLETTPGAFRPNGVAASSPYAAKLNATGSAMVYATYLGGGANDAGNGIAVDANGNAYVVGTTRSPSFPTLNPVRSSLGGTVDAFVMKLNPAGTAPIYSTYLGGTGEERGLAIAVDPAGQAHVTGWTTSADFPTTFGAYQPRIAYVDPAISNAFVTKLDSTGGTLVYSSYLGGRWCFSATVHSCLGFFGEDEKIDAGTSIAVDAAGYIYVGGYATSTEFPLIDSMQPMSLIGDEWHVPFVARIGPPGVGVAYSAVLGEKIQGGMLAQLAIDNAGGVVVAGYSGAFPTTPGAVAGSGWGVLYKVANGRYPTSVGSSSGYVGPGQSVTLRANTLTPSPGATVTFRDGTNILGTASVAQSTASLTVTLAPGVHRITATNSADGLTSPPFFQFVWGQ